MKKLFFSLTLGFIILFASCKKTGFIESPGAVLSFSADTLHFDTVFTSTGSVTQSFKIFNQNDSKLRLSDIRLGGGSASAFKINVDGVSGTNFSNVELEPNDSVYVFVSVSINPNAVNLPFLLRDSILVNYNGNKKYMQLEAYGQNANFYRNRRITKDTTWNSNLPYVILGGVTVDSNVTLTINSGCKIFSHADAPFVVNGSLKVNGGQDERNRVVFKGDRLDPGYRDLPAAWPGIFFSRLSTNNTLNYAIIQNAYQGIITEYAITANPKIVLNQCIIDNIYDAGITGFASSIKATNCLITNCGSNIVIAAGGNYSFDYCTVATYGNYFINHKSPVLSISNADAQGTTVALSATFRNSIIYGEGGTVENEILVQKKGSPPASQYNVSFQNVLYKNKDDQAPATFTNSLKNQPPNFDTINI
ncbi:MAG TPA: hypothetical protein VF623_08910, partial [Segetibacter sp.]